MRLRAHFIGLLALSCLVQCVSDATPTPDSGTSPDGSVDTGATDMDGSSDGMMSMDGGGDGGFMGGAFNSGAVFNPTAFLHGLAVQNTGEVILVGSFINVLNINNLGYMSNGNQDWVIVKLAANNGVMWVKTFGGNNSDSANGVAVDASGNIYVAGDIGSTINFGNNKTVTSMHASQTSVVLKLDGNGNTQWAVSFDQTAQGYNCTCQSVAVGPQSSIGVGCITGGNLQYTKSDNTTGNRTHSNATLGDPWLAELDPTSGGVKWGVLMSGAATTSDVVNRVMYDAMNNFYAAGTTPSPTMTGDTPVFTVTKKGMGSQASNIDAWIIKLTPVNGRSFGWAQTFGNGSFATTGNDAAVAPDGSLYLTGTFNGTRDFGKGMVTAAGTIDGYLVHLDASNASTLAQTTFGGPGNSSGGLAVAVDDMGNPILAGIYDGSGIMFGGNLPGTPMQAYANAVTAKFPPNLSAPLYVKNTIAYPTDAASPQGVRPSAIVVNAMTGVSVTGGVLSGTVDLGDGKMVTRSSQSMFIVRRDR